MLYSLSTSIGGIEFTTETFVQKRVFLSFCAYQILSEKCTCSLRKEALGRGRCLQFPKNTLKWLTKEYLSDGMYVSRLGQVLGVQGVARMDTVVKVRCQDTF